jgi:23S rRNA (cytidine2498-2'-O)-methyltransferase
LLIAHCRAGFEPETAADLRRLAAELGEDITVDAPAGRGFVAGSVDCIDTRSLARAVGRSPPIFARSLFSAAGPHVLVDPDVRTARPDRVGPLVELIEHEVKAERDASGPSRQPPQPYDTLRLETADTNEGKALSTLVRSLEARLANELAARGVLRGRQPNDAVADAARIFMCFFADGAHAYVGTSAAPWASRWTMGIPRLRKPGRAPSRSTLKLAEAFVVFLQGRESELLRAGMRAVDLGAAPGGWTWQLAQRGIRVTAVDNGPLKGDVRDDALVTHLRADGLTYLPKRPVHWMVCDIVEQPSRIAALVARWIGEGHAQRAMFNLKLPMKRRYDEVRRCEAIIRDALARARIEHTLVLRQLYHDREEVTGYVESAGMMPRRR